MTHTVDQWTSILYNDGMIAASVVGLAAMIATGSPPPVDPNAKDVSQAKKVVFGSKLYKGYYRLINLCGANAGFARNFSDPKMRPIWMAAIKTIVTAVAGAVAATEATAPSDGAEAPEGIAHTPDISHFRSNGVPVITTPTPAADTPAPETK